MQVRAAKSGVGQYIHALLESMIPQANDSQFEIYCTAENIANYTYPQFSNAHNIVWGLAEKTRSKRLAYEALFFSGELARTKPDIFHGPSNFVPRRKICPYVVTIQDLSYYINPRRTSFVRRQYWYAQTRRTVAIADKIIAISENTKRDIIHFYPESESRIIVIPLAAHHRVSPATVARSESLVAKFDQKLAGRPYALYVGTLEPGKNVERIIKSFDHVAADYPDVQLVLAGDKGWLYDPIFQAMANANHADRIHYLGHVHDEEIVDLYRFCEVFLYPSLYEGFGLPPLEAMACGAAVITSSTSSIPEVVGDAAIQIDPKNESQLQSALARVLGDPTLRDRLRAAGLQRAKMFSWESTARQTLQVYRDTLACKMP
jgi:glycosyltransferase involved in cell wall biosynthesis